MNDAHKGQVALEARDYPAAIAHLTAALKTSRSPLWLIQRSTAYQRSNQHQLALADADNAVLTARARGKRELIATAQFRRAITLHGMKRFGDARLCLHWTTKLNEKEKGLTLWVAKVKADYDKAGGEEAECNKTTVKEVPDEVKEAEHDEDEKVEKIDKGKKVEAKPEQETKGKGLAEAVKAPVAALTQTPKEKIRQEWYQSNDTVTVEIFAKGIPKDKAQVQIEEHELEISFPVGESGTYSFNATPLFSPIITSQSSFRFTPHKLEVILHKATAGVKWTSLEGLGAPLPSQSSTSKTTPSDTKPHTTPTDNTDNTANVPSSLPATQPENQKPPTYPTSSRTGPKNWDTIVSDKDVEDGEGEIDDFFKRLYKDADPDTRRAMMKSYQESGGTALSTSWSDVGKRTVEVSPPEGMEAKKWES